VVKVIHPDGSVTELRDAVSYTRKRAGERFAAPSFDLITAGSGRMFAQEKDWDRFYFATLREHIRR
jgi:hypothetical protein